MIVEGWLERAAASAPGREAVHTPQASWSYERLHTAALAGASELAERGAERSCRVGIALPADVSFVHALHSCMLLGAAAVPIDARLAPAERAAIESGCTLVVGEPLAQLAPATGSLIGGATHDLDATALVIYTSGTTGRPRPVELTFGNLLWSALGSAVALGSGPADRWLCTLPLAHVGGLSILVRSAIHASTAVVHERFEADRVLHALDREQVTLVSLVATTLERLLAAGLRDPRALRCALTGGGPVPPELQARAREAGVPVRLTYGLTQAASQVTTTPVAERDPPADSAGPPLFCTRVRIAPPGETDDAAADAGARAAQRLAGEGEILVEGPTVAPGALAADGWLRTGDLGELDERGRLRVRGREADTIISGGENVAPAEVEAVLQAHPDVAEAAVLGRPDAQWGEAVTAIVVARAGCTPDEAQLREHCAAALAPFKVPKRFELSEQPLPRTASGKLLRRSLG
jgi:O-succinylbenzoic acid--CoA ligase